MSTGLLSPVSAGIYTALNVSGLTSLAGGPFDTDVPQGTAFPYVWFSVNEENARGLGRGGLRKVNVRVSAAAQGSTTQGPAKQLETILAEVVTLLEDATLTLTGCTQAGEVVYGETVSPFDSIIGGVPCFESAANFYLWVEP